MNIAICPTNFWPSFPPRGDHWASARTEARSLINIGFGLSVMGHNVDLQNEQLKDASLIWGNVSLLKNWNTSKHYDRVILFNPPCLVPGENYEKILYIHYGPSRVRRRIPMC